MDTWNANGTTPLAGGFVFGTGTGDYTASTAGTIYYVCTAHVVSSQMKGTIVVNTVTGINDLQKDYRPKVYPNPASEYITLKTDRNMAIEEIKILDLSGKEVLILSKTDNSSDQVSLNIANLKKGIYFIRIKTIDGIETEKFLKP
jgi:hypothetical protein